MCMGIVMLLMPIFLFNLSDFQIANALQIGTATNLSDTSTDSQDPRIEIADDNVYVIWKEVMNPSASNTDMFLRISSDNGESFGESINITNDPLRVYSFDTAATGDNLYILTQEGTSDSNREVYLRTSHDRGNSFNPKINISNRSGISGAESIAVSGQNIYIKWLEANTATTFLKVSHDGGDTLSAQISLNPIVSNSRIYASDDDVFAFGCGSSQILRASHDFGESFGPAFDFGAPALCTGGPDVDAHDNHVYMIWAFNSFPSSEGIKILFIRSNDGGISFSDPMTLGTSSSNSNWEPRVSSSDDHVYVIWHTFHGSDSGIMFRVSHDNGATFEPAISVSDESKVTPASQISSNGSTLHIGWRDDSHREVYLRSSNDFGESFEDAINLSSSTNYSHSLSIGISGPMSYFLWADQGVRNDKYDVYLRQSPPFSVPEDSGSITDFNGDGFSDLAIGVSGEEIGTIQNAGGVAVVYGSSSGLSATSTPDQRFTQDTPDVEDQVEVEDCFGCALSAGDFNNDGFSDLAIGAPLEDVEFVEDAGAVNVIYGGPSGLSATFIPDQLWSKSSVGMEGEPTIHDTFGASLAKGDFDKDGYDDLAIGANGNGGSVNIIYGSLSGLYTGAATPDQIWTQNSPGIDGGTEADDAFGGVLETGDFNSDGYDDLAIGAVGEVVIVGSHQNGAVSVIYGSPQGLSATAALPDQLWSQNSLGIEGSAEVGDLFGSALSSADFNNDGYADLAIGVYGESIGTIAEAGAVNVIYGSSLGLSAAKNPDQIWQQNSANIKDIAEFTDFFGFSLASGDFNQDGYFDLAIGVPNQSVNGASYAGGLNIIYGSPSGLSASAAVGNQFFTQNSPLVEGLSEAVDRFGTTLATGDFNNDGNDDLSIGIPNEGIESADYAGALNVIYGSPFGLSVTIIPDQLWQQNSQNIEGTSESSDSFSRSLESS